MAQVTSLSPLGTPGLPYAFVAKAAAISWTSLGDAQRAFKYVAAEWGSNSFIADAWVKATAGTVYIRIYNSTDSLVVGTKVSTTLTDFTKLETAATALTANKNHVIQFGKQGSDAGVVASVFGFWNIT